ncbi:MAG: TonB-dependent receptor plug domain-containing protein [Bacteroidetes bacterium]|nr:TonB-dependent receptor plug domain-containing protein [Bacteroidales bacterium]NJO70169.1 TonB-dependent receptor plug domain-containing protein [Bacteroidota bacterium]
MKLTLITILVFTLQASASVYSQTKRFDLTLQNVSVKEVFRTIEAQSDFRFFYNDELSDVNRLVTVDLQNIKVEDVLSQLFDKSGVTYKVLENNLIVITPTGLVNQKQVISGIVSDATNNEPIPGVNVTVEGTTLGTVTDIDGKYSIDLPSGNSVLIFSFIGYITERMEAGTQTTLHIQLVPDIKKLEEVVVIGYGSRSKKDVTTSISTVNSGSIAKVVAMSPELAMQGRMTGVQIAGTSGNPMARPTIRIRGVNTWGISSPLYVIDGVPVTEFGAGIEGQEDARARMFVVRSIS